MAVLLDLIGSMTIAGFVLLMGLRLNMNIANSDTSYRSDVIVQENLVSLVQSIEYDFRKMGYLVEDPTTVVLRADSNHVRFLGDVNHDNWIDTVDWYVGPPIVSTPNPKDKMLYRRMGSTRPFSTPQIIGSLPGVVLFNLRYLDQTGSPTPWKSNIWIVETSLRVESPYKVQDRMVSDQLYDNWSYSAAFWRQTRLASRNLKRHG